MSLLPEGAAEPIEITTDTTLYWRATFEPFKRELRHDYPWIEFIDVALPPPDQQIAEEMTEADLRDGMLAELIPDDRSRGVVIEATDSALVLGTRIYAATSLDPMHQRVVTARTARGQATRVFGHRALQIMFPTVDGMSWDDVDAARRIAGLPDLRALLADIEAAAWSVADTGQELDEAVRQTYLSRFEAEVARIQPSLGETAATMAIGVALTLLTGSLAPIVGAAAGAAYTTTSAVMAARTHDSSWMAAAEHLRKTSA
jgi:hypothetical protein